MNRDVGHFSEIATTRPSANRRILFQGVPLRNYFLQRLVESASVDRTLHFHYRSLARCLRTLWVHVLACEFGIAPHISGRPGKARTSHIPRKVQLITVGEVRKDWTNWPRLGRDASDAQCPARHNNSRLWHNPGILMRSPSTSVISQTATRLHNPHCSSLVRGAPQKCIRETAGNCR